MPRLPCGLLLVGCIDGPRERLRPKGTKSTRENIGRKLFFVAFVPLWLSSADGNRRLDTLGLLMARTMKSATAFSLIETTMVVVILGVIMAVAMPRYTNSLYSYRAAMAANKIAADLTIARNDAFVSGSHRTVMLSQANNQYTLTGIPDPNFKNNANTVVNFNGNPYFATLGASTFAANTFTFDGYGIPSAGGQVTVTAGSCTHTVLVDAGSGKVTIQ